MNETGITINGQPFPHLLYHFVLVYSNWEWVKLCYSETFESLSAGIQAGLWQMGGVPKQHKTDNLSAAVKDLSGRKEFTERYRRLMDHYGMKPMRNRPGKANENGDVEQSHHRFKRALRVALLLRGSKDFENPGAYDQFVQDVASRRNRTRAARFQEEVNVMRRLPAKRLAAVTEESARVSPFATIRIRKNTYSVDSRLIGEQVKVKIGPDQIEIWHGQDRVDEVARLRGQNKHRINYRHVIDSLVKKPRAMVNYRFKPCLFPTTIFRSTYDWLVQQRGLKGSDEYVEILCLAAKESESKVEEICRGLLHSGTEITKERVSKELVGPSREVPEPSVSEPDLGQYDALCREVA